MKKLFKAIRHEDLEEVKAILEKHPEAISAVATPPPKKDMGQSPLQVALKVGAFEIVRYLMEQGADVNFMEDEETGSDWRTPVLHDAIRVVFQSLCYGEKNIPVSNEGMDLIRELLERGADPNKCASNGFASLDTCLHEAEKILESPSAYGEVQEITEKQLVILLDLLLENGADFEHWAGRGHYPEPGPGESNKVRYLDDFVPAPDRVQEFTFRGRKSKTVIKGDLDRTAHTRAVMQAYCRERKIEF